MKTNIRRPLISLALLLSLFIMTVSASAQGFDDRDALKGVTYGKALFDINHADGESIAFYLQVITSTHEELLGQGVTPEFIVAFRGPAVQFITGKAHAKDRAQAAVFEQIAVKVREMKSLGMKFEACAIATGVFQIDNDTVIPEIKVVGNTFISLIGYQAQGYRTIPIM